MERSFETQDEESRPLIERKPLIPGDRSIFEVSFNIVNATLGAGLLAIPFALKEAGLIFGILMAGLVACMANFSLIIMVHLGSKKEIWTYSSFIKYCFGRSGFWIVNLIVAINGLGTMVSYLIIIGDLVSPIAELYLGWHSSGLLKSRTIAIVSSSILVILPLVMYREIGKLSKFSILGVACVPVLIVSVIYRSFSLDVPEFHPSFFGDNVLPSIGVMAFSFVSNQMAFMNYLTLKEKSTKRWGKATSIGLTVSLALSVLLGVIGYAVFGNNVKANILSCFASDDNLINFARIFLSISMLFTYPMQFFPARQSLNLIMGFESMSRNSSDIQHYSVTILLFMMSVFIAVIVDDLGIVFELVGSFCSTMIAYLMPGTACIVILNEFAQKTRWFYMTIFLVSFGAFTMIAGTISTIKSIKS